MCEILFGKEFVREQHGLTSLINANSPLVWDSTMLGAAEAYARANQACIITPFILSGAMSPVTVAGTLTQVLAEVLAGTAFCQLARPGAPVDLRHVRLDAVDAIGRADLRHARGGAARSTAPANSRGG